MMTTTPILTNDVIAEAMLWAKTLGCPPEGRHCSSVPKSVEEALSTLQANGWCRFGSVVDMRSYGPSWDVMFNVDSGGLRLDRLP
jgi:hypothetical protein